MRFDKRHVYALFHGDGIPVINAWNFDACRIETMASDRLANDDAFAGEHIRWLRLADYNKALRDRGLGFAAIKELSAPGTNSGWYAAIGTDGTRAVVWGIGESEQAAREDAARSDELSEADLDALTLRPITDEQAVRIQRGEVDCKTLGIETARKDPPGWTSAERQAYIDEKW